MTVYRDFVLSVTAQSAAPSWFTALGNNEWAKIGVRAQSASNPADLSRIALPDAGGSFPLFPNGTFDFSGGCIDPTGEQLIVFGGGHSSGIDNGAYAFPLTQELGTIRWKRWAHTDFPALPQYFSGQSPGWVPWETLRADANAGTYRIEQHATPSDAIDVAGVTRADSSNVQRLASYFRGANFGTGGPGSSHTYQRFCFAPDSGGGLTLWQWGLSDAFNPNAAGGVWNTPLEADLAGPDSYGAECVWKVNPSRRVSGLSATGTDYAQSSWANTAWDLVRTRAEIIGYGGSYRQSGAQPAVYNPVQGHIVSFGGNLANANVWNHINPSTGAMGQSSRPALAGSYGALTAAPASFIKRDGTADTTHQFAGVLGVTSGVPSFRIIDLSNYANAQNTIHRTISWPAGAVYANGSGLVWHAPSQAFIAYGIFDAGIGPYVWKIAPATPGNWFGANWTCTKIMLGGSGPTSADVPPGAAPSTGAGAQIYGRFNILRSFGGGANDALVYAPHQYGPVYVAKLSTSGI